MRDDMQDDIPEHSRAADEWIVPVTLAIAIIICIVVFVWLFLLLDPFISDFTSGDDIPPPEAVGHPGPRLARLG